MQNKIIYEQSLSITHRHLIATLNSIVTNNYKDCGKIRELYGYDVDDHGVQSTGYFKGALTRLLASCPNISGNAGSNATDLLITRHFQIAFLIL